MGQDGGPLAGLVVIALVTLVGGATVGACGRPGRDRARSRRLVGRRRRPATPAGATHRAHRARCSPAAQRAARSPRTCPWLDGSACSWRTTTSRSTRARPSTSRTPVRPSPGRRARGRAPVRRAPARRRRPAAAGLSGTTRRHEGRARWAPGTVRHGKSTARAVEPADHLRPLAHAGGGQAPEAGRWLADPRAWVELAPSRPLSAPGTPGVSRPPSSPVPPLAVPGGRPLVRLPRGVVLGVVRELPGTGVPTVVVVGQHTKSRSWWPASRVAGCRCRRPRWPSIHLVEPVVRCGDGRGPGCAPTAVRRPGELQVDDGQDDRRDPDQGGEHRRHQPGAFAAAQGVYAVTGHDPSTGASPPLWADLAAGIPSLAILLTPCVAGVVHGRRAMRPASAPGWCRRCSPP